MHVASISLSDLNIAYLAEEMNKLWKIQWDVEWKKAKKQRKQQNVGNKNYPQVDLIAIASGNIAIKKKRKQVAYAVGFDEGFTKFVFKENLKRQEEKKNK